MVYISRKLKTSWSEKNEDMCSIHIYHLYLGKKLCTCSKQDTEIMFVLVTDIETTLYKLIHFGLSKA